MQISKIQGKFYWAPIRFFEKSTIMRVDYRLNKKTILNLEMSWNVQQNHLHASYCNENQRRPLETDLLVKVVDAWRLHCMSTFKLWTNIFELVLRTGQDVLALIILSPQAQLNPSFFINTKEAKNSKGRLATLGQKSSIYRTHGIRSNHPNWNTTPIWNTTLFSNLFSKRFREKSLTPY